MRTKCGCSGHFRNRKIWRKNKMKFCCDGNIEMFCSHFVNRQWSIEKKRGERRRADFVSEQSAAAQRKQLPKLTTVTSKLGHQLRYMSKRQTVVPSGFFNPI